MMKTVLVFNQNILTPSHRKQLSSVLPDAELIYCDGGQATPEQMAKADLIFGQCDPKLLRHCQRLKLLQLTSAGTDGYVDAMPKGAVLTNATGGYGLALSEHMLALLMCLMKKLHIYQRNQLDCKWQDEGPITSVYGATVLIIGLGDIGGEFAERIHSLGGYTIGIRRTANTKPDYLDELYQSDSIDRLLPRADVVALCLPSTSQTVGLIDRRRIELMKDGAFLLNVGRGNAIDQNALCHALTEGKLGGAGLDVTNPEPLPANHPLWKLPNTIITPHIAGGAHLPETLNRILEIAIHNFSAVYTNKPLRNEVDYTTGYRKL